MTFKPLIFENFRGPEVVGSSLYQKNIGAQFTHLYVPSLCKEFFVMRHNIGHSNVYWQAVNMQIGFSSGELSLIVIFSWL